MGSGTYPTNENGIPVCARPTEDGQPCLHEVMVPGAPCEEHRGRSPMDDEPIVWRPRDPQWTL
jgi:hypothetical protein